MQSNKSKGTSIELLLGRALWAKGIRYRKNNNKIFGSPDFSIVKYRLAIFVDGEFWHGRNWESRKSDHKTNIDFWVNKIEKNIQRDIIVNERLRMEGWTVLRFWEKEIKRNLESCILQIETTLDGLRDY